eukprot:gnl/Dysnectes_brevis/1062_a1183_4463.p1 GENE.gnl/Dysnectes_brevis/1062_a1183_4463~~gnl/Dysnectes_brevis/1062_a1183_4463.p1  ORF type:complete len:504 (+),score=163.04 gnl/Dysnectes_brevis/1062_a1183_4463:18-1529(+)
MLYLLGLLGLICFVTSTPVHIYSTTDIHSWLFSHLHNETIDADIGSLVSFYQHAKFNHAVHKEACFFFDSGDFIQGTALSDASPIVGEYAYDATKYIPYSALTIGNHDLSIDESFNYMIDTFVPHWNGSLVSYNVYYTDKYGIRARVGSPYIITESEGVKALVTGVIYDHASGIDFVDITDPSLMYMDSEFNYMLTEEEYDIVVVLVHIGYNQSPDEIDDIYYQIRDLTDAPITVLGGHEHQYDWVQPWGDNSVLMESKCFLETIGHLEFDLLPDNTMGSLDHQFIPMNNLDLTEYLGLHSTLSWMTKKGDAARAEVQERCDEMDIFDVVGSSPAHYDFLNDDLDDPASEWNLWMRSIIPTVLIPTDKAPTGRPVFYITGTSLLENDIYEGEVSVNDLYVTMPFDNEWFIAHRDMTPEDVNALYIHMNHLDEGINSPEGWLHYFIWPPIDQLPECNVDVISTDYDGSKLDEYLADLGLQYDFELYSDLTPFAVYDTWVSQEWN